LISFYWSLSAGASCSNAETHYRSLHIAPHPDSSLRIPVRVKVGGFRHAVNISIWAQAQHPCCAWSETTYRAPNLTRSSEALEPFF